VVSQLLQSDQKEAYPRGSLAVEANLFQIAMEGFEDHVRCFEPLNVLVYPCSIRKAPSVNQRHVLSLKIRNQFVAMLLLGAQEHAQRINPLC